LKGVHLPKQWPMMRAMPFVQPIPCWPTRSLMHKALFVGGKPTAHASQTVKFG
jgi:hypothetical protein